MNIGYPSNNTFIRRSETLKLNKGIPVVEPYHYKDTMKGALKLLNVQNGIFSKEKMVELTYGPKRPDVRGFIPEYVKLDNKLLLFEGVTHDNILNWNTEKELVHYVKVLYYLENDTMKVVEPIVPNSGLYQGTMFKRDKYLIPNKTRFYHWKDLNIGHDIYLYSKTIHLYDCDLWTRKYLIEQGIEMNDPEPKPEDPIQLVKRATESRNELKRVQKHHLYPSSQFFKYGDKVLKFYGIFIDNKEYPVEIKCIHLNKIFERTTSGENLYIGVACLLSLADDQKKYFKFYLRDGTLEVIEKGSPNCGQGLEMVHDKLVSNNIPLKKGKENSKTLIKRQKVMIDRKKEIDKLPCYLSPTDDDGIYWMTPEHLRTGENVEILSKIFLLNKCDEFTKQFYKMHFGIELPQIEIVQKPKLAANMVVPPHEYSLWGEGMEDCCKPHAKSKTKVTQISLNSKELADTTLRFSASLDTPRKTEHSRLFTIHYYMEDNTIKIYEEMVKNSGYQAGTFLKRSRIRKDLGRTKELTPSLTLGCRPEYYGIADFYIGAKIKANGSIFIIKDADLAVFRFMEQHPEMYPDTSAKEQRELADYLKGYKKLSNEQKMLLLQELKDEVLKNYGTSTFPVPQTLNLGTDYRQRHMIEEELFSANLPISQYSLKKLLDAFSFKERTDVNEVKTILKVALGHDQCR